jgi:ABC-type sugar transport system substrate-binding protein
MEEKMKKAITLALVLLMAAGISANLFAGGGKQSDQVMVGYAVMRMVDEYWGNQIKGMQSANAANGNKFKLEIADSNNDGQVCLENALSLLSRGAKVLMVSAPDPRIGPAIMERANALKVPVITSDVYIEGSYFLTHDEVKAGELVGDFAGQYFLDHFRGQKAKVAFLTHAAVAAQVDQRINGFKSAFSKKVPDAVFLPVQDAEGLREKGANIMADIITANPDVNIVFSVNDDIALGAASAIEARGLSEKVASFGQGGIGEAAFQALLDSKSPYKGTAAFMPFGHGESAVTEFILPLLEGKTPAKTVYSPLETASAANARKFLDDMAKNN